MSPVGYVRSPGGKKNSHMWLSNIFAIGHTFSAQVAAAKWFIFLLLQVECEPSDNVHLRIAKLQAPQGSFEGVISIAPFPIAGWYSVTSIEIKSNKEPVRFKCFFKACLTSTVYLNMKVRYFWEIPICWPSCWDRRLVCDARYVDLKYEYGLISWIGSALNYVVIRFRLSLHLYRIRHSGLWLVPALILLYSSLLGAFHLFPWMLGLPTQIFNESWHGKLHVTLRVHMRVDTTRTWPCSTDATAMLMKKSMSKLGSLLLKYLNTSNKSECECMKKSLNEGVELVFNTLTWYLDIMKLSPTIACTAVHGL